jgi:hypothetical protein
MARLSWRFFPRDRKKRGVTLEMDFRGTGEESSSYMRVLRFSRVHYGI